MEERHKLICLPDCSDHGWGVVDKYTGDDLADDPGNEKRIECAERVAKRKAEKQWRKCGQASEVSKWPAAIFVFSPSLSDGYACSSCAASSA